MSSAAAPSTPEPSPSGPERWCDELAQMFQLLVLTDRTQTRGQPLVDVIAAAVEGGARVVVVREKDLSHHERSTLCASIAPLLSAVGGVLLAGSDSSLPVDGVHLAAKDPFPSERRTTPDGNRFLVGRSCHTYQEVKAAELEGCDYVTLSPIFVSHSKPGYGPPLGPEAIAMATATLPVLALGGVTPKNIGSCMHAGAAGAAIMGPVMRSADPAGTVQRFLSALSSPR